MNTEIEHSPSGRQLRCTCGFAEKVEGALERILSRKKGINFRHSENILCAWDNETDYEVECVNLCDLPASILELADKVKPPKPKERESQVGDVMQEISRGGVYLVIGFDGDGNPTLNKDHFRRRGILSPSQWRNLSIEAEQAGEK